MADSSDSTTNRLAELRQRWEREPDSRIYLQLADELRRLEQIDEAVAVLEKGLERRPNDLSGMVALGRYRLELGDLEGAVAILETVAERDPAHLVANKLLIEGHLQRQDAEQAQQRLDLYRLLNDRDPELNHLAYRLQMLQSGSSQDETAASQAENLELPGSDEPAEEAAPIAPVESGGAADDSPSAEESTELAGRDTHPLERVPVVEPPPVSALPDSEEVFDLGGPPAPVDWTGLWDEALASRPASTEVPSLAAAPPASAPAPDAPAHEQDSAPASAPLPVDDEPFGSLVTSPTGAGDLDLEALLGMEQPQTSPSASGHQGMASEPQEVPGPPAEQPPTQGEGPMQEATLDELLEASQEQEAITEPTIHAAEEVSVAEEAAPFQEVPAFEEVSEAEEQPAAEEAAPFQEVPAFEGVSEAEKEPAADEAIAFEEVSAFEEVPAVEPMPAESAAPFGYEPEARLEAEAEKAAAATSTEEAHEEPKFELPSFGEAEPEPDLELPAAAEPEPVTESTPDVQVEPELVAESEPDAEAAEAAVPNQPAVPAMPQEEPPVADELAAVDDEEERPATATLGEIYRRQGHLDEAESIFRRVLTRHPNDMAARTGMAKIALARRGGERHELRAADLLAKSGSGQALPEGVTAKKILVLKAYLNRIRSRLQGASQ